MCNRLPYTLFFNLSLLAIHINIHWHNLSFINIIWLLKDKAHIELLATSYILLYYVFCPPLLIVSSVV